MKVLEYKQEPCFQDQQRDWVFSKNFCRVCLNKWLIEWIRNRRNIFRDKKWGNRGCKVKHERTEVYLNISYIVVFIINVI